MQINRYLVSVFNIKSYNLEKALCDQFGCDKYLTFYPISQEDCISSGHNDQNLSKSIFGALKNSFYFHDHSQTRSILHRMHGGVSKSEIGMSRFDEGKLGGILMHGLKPHSQPRCNIPPEVDS